MQTMIWEVLKITLAGLFREAGSDISTMPLAAPTAAAGVPIRISAIIKVQLAVTCPPYSRRNQRRGRSSVTRQHPANSPSATGCGPSKPRPCEAQAS